MTKALELAKFGREAAPTGLVVGDSDAQTLSSKTFSDGPVFSGLNANAIPYLNASKVLSSSSTFVFDGTNIGLGIASPAATLHVNASGGGTIRASRSSVGGEYVQLDHDGTDGTLRVSGNNKLYLTTNGSTRVTVTGSGKVGVGTPNPTEILTISHSDYQALGIYRNLDYNSVGAMGVRMYFGGYVGSTATASAAIDGTLMTATTGRLSLSNLIGGTLTESLRIDTNGSVRIGGTFAAQSSTNEKLTVDGVSSQAATLSNSSDTYGTVYIKNRSTTAATIQPYLYFNDGSGGNRAGFGVKYTDASLHHYAQGGINWYVGSSGFSGLAATLTSTGLGIGTSPQTLLTLRTTHSAPTSTTYTGALLIHDEPNNVVPHLGMGIAYDGGGNYSWIQSNSSAGTYPLILQGAGGAVGIGTKTPWAKFQVTHSVNNTNTAATNLSDYQNAAIILHNQDDAGTGNKAGLFFAFAGAPGLLSGIDGYKESGSWNTGLRFYTNNQTGGPSTGTVTERIRITPAGDVAIGDTTASGYKLKVAGTANVTGALVVGSYAAVGSIVANDPGAGYYSYNNRIGGGLAVAGTLYNAGNLFANRFTLNQGSAGVTRTSGTVSAGWYRFARSDFATGGFGARGGCTFYMYTTGGWSGPGQTVIELFKDYSTNGNLTVDTKGNNYFNNWRIAMDNNYAYLEGWTNGFTFGGDNTFNTIIDSYGWDSGGWTLYSEPLTAGLTSPSYVIKASYINLNGIVYQRNFPSDGGNSPDDYVTVTGRAWQSAFDNPVVDLLTVNGTPVIYANLICEVEVYQTPWSNVGTGNIHIGYANWGNQGNIKNVTTMALKSSMPSGAHTNVGTLSWSGNTLRYTSNRASNYDHYSIRYTVRSQELSNTYYY